VTKKPFGRDYGQRREVTDRACCRQENRGLANRHYLGKGGQKFWGCCRSPTRSLTDWNAFLPRADSPPLNVGVGGRGGYTRVPALRDIWSRTYSAGSPRWKGRPLFRDRSDRSEGQGAAGGPLGHTEPWELLDARAVSRGGAQRPFQDLPARAGVTEQHHRNYCGDGAVLDNWRWQGVCAFLILRTGNAAERLPSVLLPGSSVLSMPRRAARPS